jgi:hypothetical protein
LSPRSSTERWSTPLLIGSGLFWIPWWILIGYGLLRVALREKV